MSLVLGKVSSPDPVSDSAAVEAQEWDLMEPTTSVEEVGLLR